MAALLAREAPASAPAQLLDLTQIDFAVVGEEPVYLRAIALAAVLDHHLFDTLYHAVALEHADALLVTADNRYFRKARHLGRIVRLPDAPALLDTAAQ